MDNWWIYILIILIFVVRWVINKAAVQRADAQTSGENPSSGDITGSEWRGVFPKQEVVMEPVKKVYPKRTAPTPATTRLDSYMPKSQFSVEEEESKQESEKEPSLWDKRDIKRGIIVSEILNRKY